MIYRPLFSLVAIPMLLGCGVTTAYRVGADPEINAIRMGLDQQRAVEIITHNVKYWEGCRSSADCRERNRWFWLNFKANPAYSGSFTATPAGVKFKTHGETQNAPYQQGFIDYADEFEFSEIRTIITTVDSFSGRNTITLKSNRQEDWYMEAEVVGGHNNISSQKKILAALEILCPNVSK